MWVLVWARLEGGRYRYPRAAISPARVFCKGQLPVLRTHADTAASQALPLPESHLAWSLARLPWGQAGMNVKGEKLSPQVVDFVPRHGFMPHHLGHLTLYLLKGKKTTHQRPLGRTIWSTGLCWEAGDPAAVCHCTASSITGQQVCQIWTLLIATSLWASMQMSMSRGLPPSMVVTSIPWRRARSRMSQTVFLCLRSVQCLS